MSSRGDTLRFKLTAILPALFLFSVIYLVSIGFMASTSLFKWDSLYIEGFVGIRNYVRMFSDRVESPIFYRAVLNNLSWSFIAAFVHIPLAILTAIILAGNCRGWKVYRVILFLPHVISITAFAVIYKQVFNPSFGLLKGLFGFLGIASLQDVNWLFDPGWAWPSIIMTWVFHVGFFAVVVMADVVSIPIELFESAQIDGAGAARRAVSITLPLIRNTVGTCVILDITGGLKYFEGLYLMTNGGPNYRTETLALYLFQKLQLLQNSYANAIGVALLALGLFVVLVANRAFRIGKSAY